MLLNKITDLPVQDLTLRQKLLKEAFLTSENDSVRGIYAQARCLCQKRASGSKVSAQALKIHTR